jgi:hypothetical protein
MNTDNLRKHGVKIVAIFSIILLIVAANLDSPSLWFVLPAWFMLTGCIAIRFSSVPHDSPYKKAFYLMGIPLLFFFPLWETPFHDFVTLIFEPSGEHLMHFMTSKPFLVLVIIYFVLACMFYAELHEKVVERYKERIEILKKECERLTQKDQ